MTLRSSSTHCDIIDEFKQYEIFIIVMKLLQNLYFENKMLSRSARAETRQSRKEDIKRRASVDEEEVEQNLPSKGSQSIPPMLHTEMSHFFKTEMSHFLLSSISKLRFDLLQEVFSNWQTWKTVNMLWRKLSKFVIP